MKLTITKVFRADKAKDGTKYMTKGVRNPDGSWKIEPRPYSKIGIKTKEYGDKWISGFDAFWNRDWKEGMEVETEVEQNGDFLNLKKPDPMADILKVINDLAERVAKLESSIHPQSNEVDDDKPLPF
jgi:hypothetical protein